MRSICLAVLLAAAPMVSAHACNETLAVVEEWSITPFDADNNKLVTTIRFKTEKPIRMIDGSFGFEDALGERVASARMDRDAAIPAGGTHTQDGIWGPNTFERLLKLRKEEVKPFTCVRAILFEDGSKQEFE
ncbi:hypothetical protein ACLE20_13495 [Rhizobium sp. YIM 134829]|uniref:hypothetical protein n=1 Tax=Rhizobium sp. YIM 134829 TaxID=3390453 RepID=UPI00397E3E6E